MADPAIDYEIELDIYGHIHVLRSPFFDVGFGFDDNVEDYLNRILPTLVDAIDEQFSDYEWIIQGHSPASPTPASSLATSPLGVTCVLVVSEDDAKVKRAFQTLLTYVGNVARNPNEEKFRKIRLNNATFQDRVGSLHGGIQFLEICGFEKQEGGEFLFLPGDKVDMVVLNSAGSELNSAITNPFFGIL